MPKRIAVLVSQHYTDAEYMYPVEAFRAARHSICNIEIDAAKVVYGSAHHSSTTIDRSIYDIAVDDFDALFIPGGESAHVLAQNAQVLAFIRAFNQAQKTILSICDASLLLSAADILSDRLITSIRPHAAQLQQAGGIYYDAELVNDNNQIISSRHLDDLPVFVHECLTVLKT